MKTWQQISEQFNKEFVDINNRGIVQYRKDPWWDGECQDCGQKFKGTDQIYAVEFGHKDCPVKNTNPKIWFKKDDPREILSFLKQNLNEYVKELLEPTPVDITMDFKDYNELEDRNQLKSELLDQHKRNMEEK